MKIEQIFSYLQGFAIFCFFALSFIIPSGYNYGVALLLITAIFFLIKNDSFQYITYAEKTWFILVLLYSTLTVAMLFYHNDDIGKYDGVSKFILCLILIISFAKKSINHICYQLGICLGCISAFIIALFTRISLNWEYPVNVGYQNHIEFSNISVVLGTAALFLTLNKNRNKFLTPFFFLCAFSSFIASLLSGGRGGWIMMPLVAIIYLIACRGKWPSKTIRKGEILFILAAIVVIFTPQFQVKNHFEKIVQNVQEFQQGNIRTSQGQRIEMWKFGLDSIIEKPLVGWGSSGQFQEKERLAKQGYYDTAIIPFTHLHSDYIDRWSKFGLIGEIALLLIYFGPLWLFCKALFKSDQEINKVYAWTGIAISATFMTGSLSNTNFTHNIDVLYFLLLETIFITSLKTKTD